MVMIDVTSKFVGRANLESESCFGRMGPQRLDYQSLPCPLTVELPTTSSSY